MTSALFLETILLLVVYLSVTRRARYGGRGRPRKGPGWVRSNVLIRVVVAKPNTAASTRARTTDTWNPPIGAAAGRPIGQPVHFAELVARLRAALRRAGSNPAEVVHDLRLDPVSHEMSTDGDAIGLTPTEFRLLTRLVAEQGSVVRRHQLLATGWPPG